MANRNIDESLRKPRRTKGTPFYVQRNLYSLATLAIGGVCWFLYELWPQARQLKKSEVEGKFESPEVIRERFRHAGLATTTPGFDILLPRLRKRQE